MTTVSVSCASVTVELGRVVTMEVMVGYLMVETRARVGVGKTPSTLQVTAPPSSSLQATGWRRTCRGGTGGGGEG